MMRENGNEIQTLKKKHCPNNNTAKEWKIEKEKKSFKKKRRENDEQQLKWRKTKMEKWNEKRSYLSSHGTRFMFEFKRNFNANAHKYKCIC